MIFVHVTDQAQSRATDNVTVLCFIMQICCFIRLLHPTVVVIHNSIFSEVISNTQQFIYQPICIQKANLLLCNINRQCEWLTCQLNSEGRAVLISSRWAPFSRVPSSSIRSNTFYFFFPNCSRYSSLICPCIFCLCIPFLCLAMPHPYLAYQLCSNIKSGVILLSSQIQKSDTPHLRKKSNEIMIMLN